MSDFDDVLDMIDEFIGEEERPSKNPELLAKALDDEAKEEIKRAVRILTGYKEDFPDEIKVALDTLLELAAYKYPEPEEEEEEEEEEEKPGYGHKVKKEKPLCPSGFLEALSPLAGEWVKKHAVGKYLCPSGFLEGLPPDDVEKSSSLDEELAELELQMVLLKAMKAALVLEEVTKALSEKKGYSKRLTGQDDDGNGNTSKWPSFFSND